MSAGTNTVPENLEVHAVDECIPKVSLKKKLERLFLSIMFWGYINFDMMIVFYIKFVSEYIFMN